MFFATAVVAQNGFQFNNDKKNKISIPFRFINNLVFIPIKVNGVELNFLVDSGAEETILFSLEKITEIGFNNVERVRIIGLGGKDAVDGLKSEGNLLEIEGMKSSDYLLYVVLDPSFNLSSHIGITINGIIGFPFFKNNLVEINYNKEKVFFYKETARNRKRLERRFTKVPISINNQRPYVNTSFVIDTLEIKSELLIDTGNSDALWLFENKSKEINVPVKHFKDYLGEGLGGVVEGKRARISKFSISKFKFNKPIVAFPDSTSIEQILLFSTHLGSVGGETLKRFSVVFDYDKGNLFLRKNKKYKEPFTYNKSGIEIKYSGKEWVKEMIPIKDVIANLDTEKIKSDSNQFKIELKSVYEIVNIREDSEAAKSGLQIGDILYTVNGKDAYKYTLEEINFLFRSDDEKWIELEVKRGNEILKFRFQLLDIL